MTELERLDFNIHSTEIKMRNTRDYYNFAVSCGGIEERGDALLRMRELEVRLAELRRQRAMMTGGDNT